MNLIDRDELIDSLKAERDDLLSKSKDYTHDLIAEAPVAYKNAADTYEYIAALQIAIDRIKAAPAVIEGTDGFTASKNIAQEQEVKRLFSETKKALKEDLERALFSTQNQCNPPLTEALVRQLILDQTGFCMCGGCALRGAECGNCGARRA